VRYLGIVAELLAGGRPGDYRAPARRLPDRAAAGERRPARSPARIDRRSGTRANGTPPAARDARAIDARVNGDLPRPCRPDDPRHPMEFPATLCALLAARSDRDTPMLFDRERPLAYAALADEAAALAGGLAALGVRAGDRVAIWLPNVPAWLASFFACARLGAIAVAVNTRFRAHELADIVGRSGARVLITWPGFDKVDFDGVLAGCTAGQMPALEAIVEYAEDAAGHPLAAGRARPRPSVRRVHYATLRAHAPMREDHGTPTSGCAIVTTSGTTKAPKFVLHDQRTLIGHAHDVVRGFGLHARSVTLLAPPLCGVFGLCNALAAIAAGRPFLMTPAWDAAQAAEWIDRYGVTHLNATDDALAQLLACNARTPAFPTLEFSGYAAFNPAQDDIVERADARGLKVLGLYGISEIQALFARQDERASLADRRLAGGRPVSPLAQVRVRDPESGRVLAHGEQGELEFLAPGSRMVGYFGNDEATAAATTADGWYRSGDLGYTQPDGRFVYLTRLGDTLRLGGFLVSPLEIETLAQQVAGVDGCQVVGVPHAGALRAVAFVTRDQALAPQPDEAALEQAVIAHLTPRLARYKVPVRVFAIDAFPVTEGTNATKIQKHRLRDLAIERLAAAG
jgi:fatty-acyl-CoA synthase